MFWKVMVPGGAAHSAIAVLWSGYRLVRSGGLLLLLSLLHVNGSVYMLARRKMVTLGEDALTHLEKVAASALRIHTGSHSVGCIKEPKEHERLNCSLVSTFSSYLQATADLDGLDPKLQDKLLAIRLHIQDLGSKNCSSHLANTCETAFHSKYASKNLEKLRSLLVLFVQWIVKPMEY